MFEGRRWLGRVWSGRLDPDPDKCQKLDGWMDIEFTKHCYTFKKALYFNDTVHKKQMPAFALVGHKCKANKGSFGMNSPAGPIILQFLMQNLYTQVQYSGKISNYALGAAAQT